jgi:hypothetical protein
MHNSTQIFPLAQRLLKMENDAGLLPTSKLKITQKQSKKLFPFSPTLPHVASPFHLTETTCVIPLPISYVSYYAQMSLWILPCCTQESGKFLIRDCRGLQEEDSTRLR